MALYVFVTYIEIKFVNYRLLSIADGLFSLNLKYKTVIVRYLRQRRKAWNIVLNWQVGHFAKVLSLLVLSYFDDPNLIGTHTHCLLTEQPACRRPVTVAAVRRARVLGICSAVRVIATTWTKVDDKLVSAATDTTFTDALGTLTCVMLMS